MWCKSDKTVVNNIKRWSEKYIYNAIEILVSKIEQFQHTVYDN